nr:capsid protein [Bat astrovirus]
MSGDGESAQGGKPKQKKQHKKQHKKPSPNEKKEIKEEVKKEVKKQERKVKKKVEGPKPRMRERVTASLGVISGNGSNGPNLSLCCFTNPTLIKSPEDDTTFGPLQAAAAQFSMWRLRDLVIRVTPLVGSSAVSGTLLRASLNPSQQPGMVSWGGLGTRTHRDVRAGGSIVWKIRDQDLAGPRQGGWWFTDMNNEGAQSGGMVLEMHSFGKTNSTYKDEAWEGPLWIVELSGLWEFTNYNSTPALGTLSREEEKVAVTVTSTEGEPIKMSLPTTSKFCSWMSLHEPEPRLNRAGEANVGEVIYQVVDTGAELASAAAPPPFGWLIKGGWWFVKKLLGRGRNAASQDFVVYASLEDAQNNRPALATGSTTSTPTTATLAITQLNSPNVGTSANVPATTSSGPQPADGHFTFSSDLASVWAMSGTLQSNVWCAAATHFRCLRGPTGQPLPLLVGTHYIVQNPVLTESKHEVLKPTSNWTIQLKTPNTETWTTYGTVLGYKMVTAGWNFLVLLWECTSTFNWAATNGGLQDQALKRATLTIAPSGQATIAWQTASGQFTTGSWPGPAGAGTWFLSVFRTNNNNPDTCTVQAPQAEYTFTSSTPNTPVHTLLVAPSSHQTVTLSVQLEMSTIQLPSDDEERLVDLLRRLGWSRPDMCSDSSDSEEDAPDGDVDHRHQQQHLEPRFPPDYTVVSTTREQQRYEELRKLGVTHINAVEILGFDPTV